MKDDYKFKYGELVETRIIEVPLGTTSKTPIECFANNVKYWVKFDKLPTLDQTIVPIPLTTRTIIKSGSACEDIFDGNDEDIIMEEVD